MKAFVKTLFGDLRNVAVVAVVVVVAVALIAAGQPDLAAYAVPLLAMAGIIWLARH
jgi:hypothetical protein